MKKGFMRAGGDARSVWQLIGELNEAGVSTRFIHLGDDFSEAVAQLTDGDRLIVPRLEMICSEASRLPGLVDAVLTRGATLEVLDCPWLGGRNAASRCSTARSKGSGRKPGRPAGDNVRLMNQCVALYKSSQISIREICQQLGCSERTIYRYLSKSRQNDSSMAALPYRSRGRKSASSPTSTARS